LITDEPLERQVLELMRKSLHSMLSVGEFDTKLHGLMTKSDVYDIDAVISMYSSYLNLRNAWAGVNECRREISTDQYTDLPVARAIAELSRIVL
jgi:hypothetical protein